MMRGVIAVVVAFVIAVVVAFVIAVPVSLVAFTASAFVGVLFVLVLRTLS